jgi:hypothetical protein
MAGPLDEHVVVARGPPHCDVVAFGLWPKLRMGTARASRAARCALAANRPWWLVDRWAATSYALTNPQSATGLR